MSARMAAAPPTVPAALGGVALRWELDSDAVRDAGALPPEPAALAYGVRTPDSPYPSRDFAGTWRRIEAGYQVQPADCPPIRVIAGYGWVVRCPGLVIARRAAVPSAERRFDDDFSSFGLAIVGGAEWPGSDSGRVASWIVGSQYVKVQTGVSIWFPDTVCLYQGPIPNAGLCERAAPQVMAGIEYPSRSRRRVIDGVSCSCAMLNVICELPASPDEELRIERGDLLTWFFPVSRKAQATLTPIAVEHGA